MISLSRDSILSKINNKLQKDVIKTNLSYILQILMLLVGLFKTILLK